MGIKEAVNAKWDFNAFLEQQKRTASGQRLEMLNRDMTGTRKLVESVLLPVLPSLDEVVLEHELVSLSGVRIYVDAFYPPLGAAFECDGFISHGEGITRDRFSFERMRIRTIAAYGYRYVPFSFDEMDKKPESCCRSVFELLGRYGSVPASKLFGLPVNEREILRFALVRGDKGFGLPEAGECLQLGLAAASRILRRMLAGGLLVSTGRGAIRHHAYKISGKGKSIFN